VTLFTKGGIFRIGIKGLGFKKFSRGATKYVRVECKPKVKELNTKARQRHGTVPHVSLSMGHSNSLDTKKRKEKGGFSPKQGQNRSVGHRKFPAHLGDRLLEMEDFYLKCGGEELKKKRKVDFPKERESVLSRGARVLSNVVVPPNPSRSSYILRRHRRDRKS